ncbi:MAG: alcohol dehydrogenase [Myxococcota bacterium]
MDRMQAVVVREAGGPFEVVERPIPEPGPGQVRIAVEACGICHSDQFVKDGLFPGLEYPRIPGHEVVGRIDELYGDVTGWDKDQRVGVGWHGGHCFQCDACRQGDFVLCENQQICGISYDGGYAEYMVAPVEALAPIPDSLDSADAAPLLCAGVTTYNAIRHTGARPGDVVAVQGIGGLGHLAVQYSRHMGFHTVAVSSGPDKESLARELGADTYVDASAGDPAEALQALGGARVLITTAPNAEAMSPMVDGLSRNGELLVVGASTEPIQVSPLQLIMARRAVRGWPSGTAMDSQETLRFSALRRITPMVETMRLEEASDAYERMLRNDARFRVVLTTKHADR